MSEPVDRAVNRVKMFLVDVAEDENGPCGSVMDFHERVFEIFDEPARDDRARYDKLALIAAEAIATMEVLDSRGGVR